MGYVIYNKLNFHLEGDTLRLTGRGVRELAQIEGLENFPNLKEINLSYNRLENLNGLEKLTNLKRVILKNNEVKDLSGIRALINLEELDLDGNNIEEINGFEVLSSSNLRVLRLDYNRITEIKGLETLVNLEELYINNNQINEINGLTKLTNLKHLNLGSNPRIGPNNKITTIGGLETLFKLQVLILNQNEIEEISGLKTLINLKELDLSGNRIREIKGLNTLINLQKLDLRKNHNFKEIKGLYHLSNLKKLYLPRYGLDSALVQELGGIDNDMRVNNPQRFINYCDPKKVKKRLEKKELEKIETERKRKENLEIQKQEEERLKAERKEKEELARKKIKKSILDLGTRFPRLQVSEIAEECEINMEQLVINIIKEMIENKEIYGKYFKSTKSVAFDQQANINEIDKLLASYEDWEEKKVGKRD